MHITYGKFILVLAIPIFLVIYTCSKDISKAQHMAFLAAAIFGLLGAAIETYQHYYKNENTLSDLEITLHFLYAPENVYNALKTQEVLNVLFSREEKMPNDIPDKQKQIIQAKEKNKRYVYFPGDTAHRYRINDIVSRFDDLNKDAYLDQITPIILDAWRLNIAITNNKTNNPEQVLSISNKELNPQIQFWKLSTRNTIRCKYKVPLDVIKGIKSKKDLEKNGIDISVRIKNAKLVTDLIYVETKLNFKHNDKEEKIIFTDNKNKISKKTHDDKLIWDMKDECIDF